jgi:hypothetical protein
MRNAFWQRGVHAMVAATPFTPEEIARVHVRVAEAVTRTADESTLPAAEQDRLLADACHEACGLLVSWLASLDWKQMRPKPSAQVVVITREDYLTFLDEGLTDALIRAGLPWHAAASLVNDARVAIERTAGHHLPSAQRDLYRDADERLRDLRGEVCTLAVALKAAVSEDAKSAGEGKSDDRASALRRSARAALKLLNALLPALIVAMVTVTPGQVETAVSAWGHDAFQVVATCLIAEQVQLHVQIEPPQPSGPGLSL